VHVAEEYPAEGVFAPLVDQVVGYLADGISVHLVGPHGSGRSELARLVADRLDDDGLTVLRLYGNRAWRTEPYGALVAAGIGAVSGAGPRRGAGEMAAALAAQLRGGRVVVVVDDADDLDSPTVGALLTSHRQRPLTVLTTSRPHHPVHPESLMLGLAPDVRIRVPTLDVDQVHAVTRRILGGPVDAGALARIAMKSGGLHGLVQAIATVGRRTHTLTLHDGVWGLPGDLWHEHLAAVVEPYLAGADSAIWDGATWLAIAGPVPLEEAEKAVDRPVLDRLFTAGLVRHSVDAAGGVVGIFPPLLAEYLRREGSAFGLAHAPGGFDTRAAGADSTVLNQRLVRELADEAQRLRGAWEADPVPATALPYVIALRAAHADHGRIERVISVTPFEHDDRDTALLTSWHATWLAVEQADEAWQLSAVAGYERSGYFARLVADINISLREQEIIQLLATGMSTGEVASALQMSVRTVETHLHNAGRKLGTGGREPLLRAATTWLRPTT